MDLLVTGCNVVDLSGRDLLVMDLLVTRRNMVDLHGMDLHVMGLHVMDLHAMDLHVMDLPGTDLHVVHRVHDRPVLELGLERGAAGDATDEPEASQPVTPLRAGDQHMACCCRLAGRPVQAGMPNRAGCHYCCIQGCYPRAGKACRESPHHDAPRY